MEGINLRAIAAKIKVGNRYRIPNQFVLDNEGHHPIESCECIGKYGTYAVFKTPKGNMQTHSYFELASGIAQGYRRTEKYVNDKGNEIVRLVT